MSMLDQTESASRAWGKILLGVSVVIFGASSAFGSREWWELVSAAFGVAFGLIVLITGLRYLSAHRRGQLTAPDEDPADD